MKSPGQPLPEESANMFVGALASKDITADVIREPIIVNDSVDDSTYSGDTVPLDRPDLETEE
jgi:hypothetical protein